MEKEFITYEQALELKELGFSEPCIDKYDPRFKILSSDMETWTPEYYPETLMLPAPLYQQAFRWFREKWNLHPHYFIQSDQTYVWCIRWFEDGLQKDVPYSSSKTYEEAQFACIEKLIEMVKGK